MAEFLNRKWTGLGDELTEDQGFNGMGKPVPLHRQQEAYRHAKEMGLNSERAWSCVSGMSNALERDEPYEAMQQGMYHLDLTGTYRMMAVLLTEPPEKSETGCKFPEISVD